MSRVNTNDVDAVWSAGYVGLYRNTGVGNFANSFDDFQVGYDNNADGDIDDAGDGLQVVDDFNSNTMTLAYDHNGNLTADGVLTFVYDAWNP